MITRSPMVFFLTKQGSANSNHVKQEVPLVLKASLRRNTLSSSDEYASEGDLGSLSSSDFLPSSCNKQRNF